MTRPLNCTACWCTPASARSASPASSARTIPVWALAICPAVMSWFPASNAVWKCGIRRPSSSRRRYGAAIQSPLFLDFFDLPDATNALREDDSIARDMLFPGELSRLVKRAA